MSVVELAIAASLFGLLLYKVAITIKFSLEFASRESAQMTMDDAAGQLLDKVTRALYGSTRESIQPLLAVPLYASRLTFQIPFGVEDGNVVLGPIEAIGLAADDPGVLHWIRDPDTKDEFRVVWSNRVRPFLEGELQNGLDDNDNGLIDEQGLTFVIDGRAIRVRLTIGRDGETVTHERTVMATIVPRNFDDLRSGVDLPLKKP
jgi:hypothetical protein